MNQEESMALLRGSFRLFVFGVVFCFTVAANAESVSPQIPTRPLTTKQPAVSPRPAPVVKTVEPVPAPVTPPATPRIVKPSPASKPITAPAASRTVKTPTAGKAPPLPDKPLPAPSVVSEPRQSNHRIGLQPSRKRETTGTSFGEKAAEGLSKDATQAAGKAATSPVVAQQRKRIDTLTERIDGVSKKLEARQVGAGESTVPTKPGVQSGAPKPEAGEIAQQVYDNNATRQSLREQMNELRAQLANMPDGPEKDEMTALLEDLDAQYQNMTDMSQELQLQLQDAMNKQQQAMQILSNIMKNQHDTLKAIIQNMR